MLTNKELSDYFSRIGYKGTILPDVELLSKLHVQHVLHVPFENLDVINQKPISLDTQKLFQKIVLDKRGGYCFELNGLFAVLLETLGFQVERLAARVLKGVRFPVPPKTHQLLLVTVNKKKYIADVGFGWHGLIKPFLFKINHAEIQHQENFMLIYDEKFKYTLQTKIKNKWVDCYAFNLENRLPIDYKLPHFYSSHSPDSILTQKLICTMPTEEGKITLIDNLLKIKKHGQLEEKVFHRPSDVDACLKNMFGLNATLNTHTFKRVIGLKR